MIDIARMRSIDRVPRRATFPDDFRDGSRDVVAVLRIDRRRGDDVATSSLLLKPPSMKLLQDDAGDPGRVRRRSPCLQVGAAQHLRREEETMPRVPPPRHARLGDRAAALQ